MQVKQKDIKRLVELGVAKDVTNFGPKEYDELITKELQVVCIGYARNIYGRSGAIYCGEKSKTLYAITKSSTAIFSFPS